MKYIKTIIAIILALILAACSKGKVLESPMPDVTPTPPAAATETIVPTEQPKFENLPDIIDEGGETILNVYNISSKKNRADVFK